MIKGTGIDITEVNRIRDNLSDGKFLNKIFSANEIEYLEHRRFNAQTAAGMFAAKEAVSKSLGTGFLSFGPCNIEILKDKAGKPYVNLTGNALMRAKKINVENIQVSISHTSEYAIAFCIAE